MRHNLSANLTKLFKKAEKAKEVTSFDETVTQDDSLSANSHNSDHLDCLMQKLLRGEQTEFSDQAEGAIEEKPIYTEWDITLRNCQVLLKGSLKSGMMILTAAESNWQRNEYRRTWRDGQYLDKFSWCGQLR